MKDHIPQIKNSFKGLWAPEGTSSIFESDETCPKDHQLLVTNVNFTINGLSSRGRFVKSGLAVPFQGTATTVHVIDNIPALNGDMLIVDNQGDLYYYDGTTSGILLSAGIDFSANYNFLPWFDRIYIVQSRLNGYETPPVSLSTMLVFGPTVAIRSAGGVAPVGIANVANSGTGVVAAGVHFFGVAYETDTGFITPPQVTNPALLLTPGNQEVSFTSIPTGPSYVVARWLIATKVIPVRVPNDSLASYISYFAVRIGDNTTTSWSLDFRDTELLRDASYLQDIYPNPPSGTSISSYHNRVCITAPGPDSSLTDDYLHDVIISRFNDPETFDRIDGLVTIAPGNQTIVNTRPTGLTDSQAYRDVFYLTKLNSTFSLTDNNDEPAFWPSATIDQTVGSRPNGIAPVKSPGSESIDYLLVLHPTGLYLFTGLYRRPEITWKVKGFLTSEINELTSEVFMVNDFNNRKVYYQLTASPINVIDYSQVSPDLSNYSNDIKFTQWESLIGTFPTSSLFLRNNKISRFNNNDNELYEISSDFSTTDPSDEQYISILIFPSDRDEDDKLIHIKGVRTRIGSPFGVLTAGTYQVILTDMNNILKGIIVNQLIDIPLNRLIEPTFTTNFTAQRISVELVFSPNAQWNLTKLVTYVKPVYSTLPFQFIK